MNKILHSLIIVILIGCYAQSTAQEVSMEIYSIQGNQIDNGSSLAAIGSPNSRFIYTDSLLIKNVSSETIRIKVKKIEQTLVEGSINTFKALAQSMDVNESITENYWELESNTILPQEAFFRGSYSSIYQGTPILGTSNITYSFLSYNTNNEVLDSVYVCYSFSNTSISPLSEEGDYLYNKEVLVTADPTVIHEHPILLHNHTEVPVSYRVSKTVLESEDGHEFFFKFGGVDYTATQNTSDASGVIIEADQTLEGSNGFIAKFNANGVDGNQFLPKVRYRFFNKAAGNDADYVTIVYNPSGVGFSELDKYGFSEPYPNPTNDYFYIDHNIQEFNVIEIKVYNAAGQLVLIHPVQKNSIQSVVNISDFQNGVYFVNIEIDGRPLGTEKLIIQ